MISTSLTGTSPEPNSNNVKLVVRKGKSPLSSLNTRELSIEPDVRCPIGRASRTEGKTPRATTDNAFFCSRVVSREHAQFEAPQGLPGRLYIIDRSTLGTFVNSERIKPNDPYLLNHRDKIQLGETVASESKEESEAVIFVVKYMDHNTPQRNASQTQIQSPTVNTFRCPSEDVDTTLELDTDFTDEDDISDLEEQPIVKVADVGLSSQTVVSQSAGGSQSNSAPDLVSHCEHPDSQHEPVIPSSSSTISSEDCLASSVKAHDGDDETSVVQDTMDISPGDRPNGLLSSFNVSKLVSGVDTPCGPMTSLEKNVEKSACLAIDAALNGAKTVCGVAEKSNIGGVVEPNVAKNVKESLQVKQPPHPYQIPVKSTTKSVIVSHRREGKDRAAINWQSVMSKSTTDRGRKRKADDITAGIDSIRHSNGGKLSTEISMTSGAKLHEIINNRPVKRVRSSIVSCLPGSNAVVGFAFGSVATMTFLASPLAARLAGL